MNDLRPSDQVVLLDEDAHGPDATSALVSALRPLGVAAIGVNCGSGPQAALEVARRLVEAGAPVV